MARRKKSKTMEENKIQDAAQTEAVVNDAPVATTVAAEVVKIKLESGMMPKKANATDAAWDLYAPSDIVVKSGRQIIDLGFKMEIPVGYAATIQPRSGFSSKGLEVHHYEGGKLVDEHYRMDADIMRGLIDSKYRDNVGVMLKAHKPIVGTHRFVIPKGTRIAQMQIVTVPSVEFVEAEELDMTDNRGGGFGHSGVQ